MYQVASDYLGLRAGCFCPDGLVELGDKCVQPNKCPPKCPEGKQYTNCGTACPQTCDNRGTVVPCTLQCVPGKLCLTANVFAFIISYLVGCVCPSEYVELEEGCVLPEECP